MTSGTAVISGGGVVRRRIARPAPGRFRRLLLMAAVVILPLQDHLPAIGGVSVLYLVFALLAAVALIAQPRMLVRAALHPIFIAGYVLVGSTLFVELLHSNTDLLWWSSMAQMIAGGVIVASYVRSERDVHATLSAFIITSLWVAVLIVRSTYWQVASAGVSGFSEASTLREAALGDLGLIANWNRLAFLCAMAVGIAASRTILSSARTRVLYALVTFLSAMASILTFSRSGIVAVAVTLAYVFSSLINRRLIQRVMLIGAAGLLLLWLAVPRVVFERFDFSLGYDITGKQESRIHIYGTLLRTLPSYVIWGVGSGNYFSKWAFEQGLSYQGVASATHNTFLQVTVSWGLAGLVGWSAVLIVAWRTLAVATRRQLQFVPLKAFCVPLALWLMASNDIADKQMSIALGMIAGLSAIRRSAHGARRPFPVKRPRTSVGTAPIIETGTGDARRTVLPTL